MPKNVIIAMRDPKNIKNIESTPETLPMNTSPTQEVNAQIDPIDQARLDANSAAESKPGYVNVNELGERLQTAELARSGAELGSQANVLAAVEPAPVTDTFDSLVGQAKADKQTFAVPMSPEAANYAQAQATQPIGSYDLWKANPNATVAELERNSEARQGILAEIRRASVNIMTERTLAESIPRTTLGKPKARVS